MVTHGALRTAGSTREGHGQEGYKSRKPSWRGQATDGDGCIGEEVITRFFQGRGVQRLWLQRGTGPGLGLYPLFL